MSFCYSCQIIVKDSQLMGDPKLCLKCCKVHPKEWLCSRCFQSYSNILYHKFGYNWCWKCDIAIANEKRLYSKAIEMKHMKFCLECCKFKPSLTFATNKNCKQKIPIAMECCQKCMEEMNECTKKYCINCMKWLPNSVFDCINNKFESTCARCSVKK